MLDKIAGKKLSKQNKEVCLEGRTEFPWIESVYTVQNEKNGIVHPIT